MAQVLGSTLATTLEKMGAMQAEALKNNSPSEQCASSVGPRVVGSLGYLAHCQALQCVKP